MKTRTIVTRNDNGEKNHTNSYERIISPDSHQFYQRQKLCQISRKTDKKTSTIEILSEIVTPVSIARKLIQKQPNAKGNWYERADDRKRTTKQIVKKQRNIDR